ncbi:MAG: GAF domain-containing sensor histidine kinase [Omnitrophica WOR_2 bacterium]
MLVHNRGRLVAWIVTGMLLVIAVLLFGMDAIWENSLPYSWRIVFSLLILLILGVLVFQSINRITQSIEDQKNLLRQVEQAEERTARVYQRLSAVFLISNRFVEAKDEKEIIDLVLRSTIELTGARGAAFVPLDEHNQPMSVVSYGEESVPVTGALLEYMASPAVRDRCKVCGKGLNFNSTCPLLKDPFDQSRELYCLPLQRGDREYGVLTIFMPEAGRLDLEMQTFLGSIMDETSLAIDGVRLRNRELDMVQQLQSIRNKNDLPQLLLALLNNAQQALESDFALLYIDEPSLVALLKEKRILTGSQSGAHLHSRDVNAGETLTSGAFPATFQPVIPAILQKVLESGDSLKDDDLSKAAFIPAAARSALEVRSMVAVLLKQPSGTAIGLVLAGSHNTHQYKSRQINLLKVIGSQVSLVLENERQMAGLEYQAMIEERSRLAREIHDGLAQSLGLLKLQIAQMQKYMEHGEAERLQQILSSSYETAANAYQDARYAIDGLRISPGGESLTVWLNQIVADFQDYVAAENIRVHLSLEDIPIEPPPEVEVQLIRILQEAFNNIRKHAGASQVWVSCLAKNGDFILEIRDNGIGFSPEDVIGPSHHGLKSMRERAELIGADFQVISLSQKGTVIRVGLPVKTHEVTS